MARTVTLSSAGTATIILDPVSKTTSVALTMTSGSSISTITVEASLDDPSTTPAPTMTWFTISSAAAMGSSTNTGLIYTVLSPIGAVRLNSTGHAGSSAVFTLKALQSVTA